MKIRKMKDSGVEWIGSIPSEWRIHRGKTFLKLLNRDVRENDEIVTCFRDGVVTLRKNRREEGFTVALKECGYQGVEPGDLVVHGMDGFAGAIGISDSRGKASPVLNVLDCAEDTRYVMYYLRSMAMRDVFLALSTGIRVRSCDLRWSKLGDIPYILPPLPEQRKIATYLDRACAKIDEIIAGTKQTIEEYKAWKASLIFEAVTGKCRIENGKCRMGGRKMRDSGIPWLCEVPEGWTIKRFKFVVKTLRKGNGITKDEVFADGEIACIRYGEIYSRYNFVAKECASRTNRRCVADPVYVERGDILFACTGELVEEIGKNILYDGYEPCIAGGDILVASHNEDPGFLNYYLNCHSSQFQKSRGKAKLKVVHARTSDIENIVVLLPSSVEQRTIANYLNKKCAAIDRVIAEKEALIADLEAYRKSLIFEVVTGKRSVGENGLVA